MSKKKKITSLYILIAFAIYCSLVVGLAWDEQNAFESGKITIDYLFTLGRVDKYIAYREYYSTIYWSFLYLVSEIFPSKYQNEIGHLINLSFSLSAIFATGRLATVLFNKEVGKLTFLVLFLFPIFFGHMAVNNKDTILAFCHVWIIYLVLRYFQKQQIKEKSKKYIILISLLVATATGIQLLFLGSLVPLFIFIIIEIFFLKKFITKEFSIKIFYIDLIKCISIFYLILIIFWIDSHSNILISPINIMQEWLGPNFATGWPWSLVNGNIYLSTKVDPLYLIINFIFKSPEYFLLSYVVFMVSIFKMKNFYYKNVNFFNYKIAFVISILIFPNIMLYLVNLPLYDGMRLFLWVVPYYCIIPALTIYYLIKNLNLIKVKIAFLILSLFFVFHLVNFVTISPYQYTYLNLLNGSAEDRYKKFENDYWGISIKELVNNVDFKTNDIVKISTCGLSDNNLKKLLKQKKNLNYQIVPYEESEYIIMTNRVLFHEGTKTCFDEFLGNEIVSVKRNGLVLSTIRKMN